LSLEEEEMGERERQLVGSRWSDISEHFTVLSVLGDNLPRVLFLEASLPRVSFQ
jgi:hypothetical protein